MRRSNHGRWKRLVLGMAGGAFGTMAMSLYWKGLQAASWKDLETAKNPTPGPFGDVAVAGPFTSRAGQGSDGVFRSPATRRREGRI